MSLNFKGQFRPLQTSNPWPAADGFGVFEHNGDIYKIGGWNNSANSPWPPPYTTSRVDVYKRKLNKWFRLPDAPFVGRHTFPIPKLGNKAYVVGGDANQGYYQKDFWEITILDWGLQYRCITPLSAALEHGRVGHICFPYHGGIELVGGQIVDGESFISNPANYSTKTGDPYYDDRWRWEPGRPDFVQQEENCGYAPACFMQGSPVKDDKMWLVGCGAYSVKKLNLPRVFGNRVYAGDASGFSLVTEDGGFPATMYNSVAVYGDDIVTAFGWNVNDMSGIYASPNGENFRGIPNLVIPPRHAASLINSAGRLAAFGGPISPPDTAVWEGS